MPGWTDGAEPMVASPYAQGRDPGGRGSQRLGPVLFLVAGATLASIGAVCMVVAWSVTTVNLRALTPCGVGLLTAGAISLGLFPGAIRRSKLNLVEQKRESRAAARKKVQESLAIVR